MNAGVEIRVIGCVKDKRWMEVRDLANLRLHTRTIICDRRRAFVGSQSLRSVELDSRRELGIIVSESKVVNGLIQTFEADWVRKSRRRATSETEAPEARGESAG